MKSNFIVGEFYQQSKDSRKFECMYIGEFHAVLKFENTDASCIDERVAPLDCDSYQQVFATQTIQAYVCIYRDEKGNLVFGDTIHKLSGDAWAQRGRFSGFVEVIRISHTG